MKGILFKPDLIKAIVDGRKTQTRRVIKPQPPEDAVVGVFNRYSTFCFPDSQLCVLPLIHARYQVGETVYIKEALQRHPALDEAVYMDGTPVFINQTIGCAVKWQWQGDTLSPMFMLQSAARYFIEITEVRAERLQEITEEGAIAEGCIAQVKDGLIFDSGLHQFSWLWDTIKPKYPFESNPWVWVYTFRLKGREA